MGSHPIAFLTPSLSRKNIEIVLVKEQFFNTEHQQNIHQTKNKKINETKNIK